MPTICSHFFFPMAISKSVSVAENMLLVCGSEAERGRRHAQPEQQSLLWGSLLLQCLQKHLGGSLQAPSFSLHHPQLLSATALACCGQRCELGPEG